MELYGSKEVARAAIQMCLTRSREEEKLLKEQFQREGIATAAVDFGGEFITSVTKIVERAVVAAKEKELYGTPILKKVLWQELQGRQSRSLSTKQ